MSRTSDTQSSVLLLLDVFSVQRTVCGTSCVPACVRCTSQNYLSLGIFTVHMSNPTLFFFHSVCARMCRARTNLMSGPLLSSPTCGFAAMMQLHGQHKPPKATQTRMSTTSVCKISLPFNHKSRACVHLVRVKTFSSTRKAKLLYGTTGLQ